MATETIITDLDPHPLALAFPDMPRDEYQALVDDVAEHGVLVPIVMHEDKILDGRHRHRAARQAGAGCPSVEWAPAYEGQTPGQFVMSMNRHRRDLTKGQRAMVAQKLLEIEAELARQRMAAGGGKDRVGQIYPTRDDGKAAHRAGAQLGVSGSSVAKAKKLAEDDPDEAEKVAKGEKSLNRAEKDAKAKKRPPTPTRTKPGPDGTYGVDLHGVTIRTREAADQLAAQVEFLEFYQRLEGIQRQVNALVKAGSPRWARFTISTFEESIRNAKKTLDMEQPFGACPYWPNCEHNNCKACKGSGWVTKRAHKTAKKKGNAA
jgi:hypothetical protein